ncbi:hypothetical protein OHR68_40325 [Spirillospora sp. NBC_00431]
MSKQSQVGQLLAVEEGVGGMLGRLDLTDDERQALQRDRDAVVAFAERLADTPFCLDRLGGLTMKGGGGEQRAEFI